MCLLLGSQSCVCCLSPTGDSPPGDCLPNGRQSATRTDVLMLMSVCPYPRVLT